MIYWDTLGYNQKDFLQTKTNFMNKTENILKKKSHQHVM